MRGEQGVVPAALNMGFVPRVNEIVTTWQHNKVTANLEREGVIQLLGEKALTVPWDAFLDVMSGIQTAEAVPSPDNPPNHATIAIRFSGEPERHRFHRLCYRIFGGIHGPTMPEFHELGERELHLTIGYPDIATVGRVGTVLLCKQYAELGRNLSLIKSHSMSEMFKSGVVEYIPWDLFVRIMQFLEDLGEDTLLSSGYFARVGAAFRGAMADSKPFEVQRPRGNRPEVEAGANFYSVRSIEATGAPISGSNIGHAIAGQVVERWSDLAEPYRKRNFVKAAEDLWDIATGLGVKEGIGSGVRAIGTIVVASIKARQGIQRDNQAKKRQGLLLAW